MEDWKISHFNSHEELTVDILPEGGFQITHKADYGDGLGFELGPLLLKSGSLGSKDEDLTLEPELDRRLQAWMHATELVDQSLEGIELTDYQSSNPFGYRTTHTVLDQRMEHIQQLADWLLNGST